MWLWHPPLAVGGSIVCVGNDTHDAQMLSGCTRRPGAPWKLSSSTYLTV